MVRAVSHYTLPGSQSLAVVCVAPPQSARDGREVLVRLSLDGALFSIMVGRCTLTPGSQQLTPRLLATLETIIL